MKLRNLCPFNPDALVRTVQFAMCPLAVLYLAGCASASYQKADAASGSLQKAAVAINLESRAIDGTMSSLDGLVDKPSSDLKPQFDRFSASLDRLIDSFQAGLKKRRPRRAGRARNIFRPGTRKRPRLTTRLSGIKACPERQEISNEFNTVNERYRENQAVVEPLDFLPFGHPHGRSART